MPVFFSGGQAAADMPLRFIDVQHAAHPHIKLGINHPQAVGNVLMYRTFAYMKLLGGGAHRRVIFNNVFAQLDG